MVESPPLRGSTSTTMRPAVMAAPIMAPSQLQARMAASGSRPLLNPPVTRGALSGPHGNTGTPELASSSAASRIGHGT
jgi:hypothetical protein